MAAHDLTVKIILLGDYNVNKADILKALNSIAPSPVVKTVSMRTPALMELMLVRGGKLVKVKIHDTAGQERYRSITTSFYRGAHGCILLFDVTKRETFDNLTIWQEELKIHSGVTDEIVTTLTGRSHATATGTIIGSGHARQVDHKTAQDYANHLGVPYEEINVNNPLSVVHLLEKLIDRIMLKASRLPTFSITIKPLDRKIEELKSKKEQRKQKCNC